LPPLPTVIVCAVSMPALFQEEILNWATGELSECSLLPNQTMEPCSATRGEQTRQVWCAPCNNASLPRTICFDGKPVAQPQLLVVGGSSGDDTWSSLVLVVIILILVGVPLTRLFTIYDAQCRKCEDPCDQENQVLPEGAIAEGLGEAGVDLDWIDEVQKDEFSDDEICYEI